MQSSSSMNGKGWVVRSDLRKYTPLRHAKLIKAWARGAKIQYLCRSTHKWKDCGGNNPRWNPLIEYRVKPMKEQTWKI